MTYSSVILADAPNHYWRCNDSGGLLLQDIGSNKIQLVGSAVPQITGYSGVAFDGGSALLVSSIKFWAPDPHAIVDPFSIELWCWPMSKRAGANQILFQWDNGASAPFFNLQYDSIGRFKWNVGNASALDPTQRNIQNWYHVVGTYTAAAGGKLYVNGTQVATSATFGAISLNQPINVGIDAGQLTSSMLTEVATYNAALSAGQVTAHFGAQETSIQPIYHLPGNLSTVGVFTPQSSDVSAVLAAVRKTF